MLGQIMELNISKAQQLVIDTMAKQGGSLGDTDVHSATLQAVIGKGLVTTQGEDHILTEEGWEYAQVEQVPSDELITIGESDPTVEVAETTTEEVQGERVEFYLELGRPMSVEIGREKGKPIMRTLPAGTRCFVVGDPIRDILRGNKGSVVWYTCAVPDTDVTFLVGRNDGNPRRPSIHKLFKYNFDDKEETMLD